MSGKDIYAITVPIVTESLERVIADGNLFGAMSPGGAFDAIDFLERLKRSNIEVHVTSK